MYNVKMDIQFETSYILCLRLLIKWLVFLKIVTRAVKSIFIADGW